MAGLIQLFFTELLEINNKFLCYFMHVYRDAQIATPDLTDCLEQIFNLGNINNLATHNLTVSACSTRFYTLPLIMLMQSKTMIQ